MDFVLTLQAQELAEGTIRGTLFAVRFHHVSEGYPDPLVGRPRLWMVIKAIKRKSEKVTRKYPVTARMMKIIKELLVNSDQEYVDQRKALGIADEDGAVIWAGIATAWLFLLRGGEWLAHDGRGYDTAKVLLGADLRTRGSRSPCGSRGAPEHVGQLAGPKKKTRIVGPEPSPGKHAPNREEEREALASTPLGDVAEVKAIQQVFGDAAYDLNISSTKSMTGHLLGAAGAVEAMACIMSIVDQVVPPTINHEHEDDQLDNRLNFTLNKAQKREVRAALSNTFGFGGHNASVVFKALS